MSATRHSHGDNVGHDHDRGDQPHSHTHRVIDSRDGGMVKTLRDTVTFADGSTVIANEWTVDYRRPAG